MTTTSKLKIYEDVFTQMSEMFQVLQLIYDDDGAIVDYYYRQVNPAFEELVNMPNDKIVGKRVKSLFGVIEDHWLKTYDEVNKTGKTVNYENYGAELNRYYAVKCWKVDTDTIAVIFSDITEKKKIETELHQHRDHLEELVKVRTSELEKKNLELNNAVRLFIGKELKIKSLEKELIKVKDDSDGSSSFFHRR